VAYAGNSGDLYDQTRTAGVWGAAPGHMLGNVVVTTPAIIEPIVGPELMVVYPQKAGPDPEPLLYTMRNGGIWTIPIAIAGAATDAPPALVALPGGAAVLAFRGGDGKLYTSRFTPGAVPPWSAPAQLGMASIASSPALAPGIGGADAELAYAASSSAFHARLTGMVWSAPVMVGGSGVTHVAIASHP
jgi:hypothetical protein